MVVRQITKYNVIARKWYGRARGNEHIIKTYPPVNKLKFLCVLDAPPPLPDHNVEKVSSAHAGKNKRSNAAIFNIVRGGRGAPMNRWQNKNLSLLSGWRIELAQHENRAFHYEVFQVFHKNHQTPRGLFRIFQVLERVYTYMNSLYKSERSWNTS